jgi:hypothetical protein
MIAGHRADQNFRNVAHEAGSDDLGTVGLPLVSNLSFSLSGLKVRMLGDRGPGELQS